MTETALSLPGSCPSSFTDTSTHSHPSVGRPGHGRHGVRERRQLCGDPDDTTAGRRGSPDGGGCSGRWRAAGGGGGVIDRKRPFMFPECHSAASSTAPVHSDLRLLDLHHRWTLYPPRFCFSRVKDNFS